MSNTKQYNLLELLDYIDPAQLDGNGEYSVYKHTSPNGKIYIGITGKSPKERYDSGHGYRHQQHFWNAIKKYGWNNFTHEVICSGLTQEAACEIEIELISFYDSANPENGYNTATGGQYGLKGYKLSEETKMRMSASRTGEKHPMYGKHHSTYTRQKISQMFTGEGHPQYGKHRSELTKEKIRKANRGTNSPNYGKALPPETRQKISDSLTISRGKPVVCVETGIVYRSATEASQYIEAQKSHIASCCRKDKFRVTAGGYHWEFFEENDNAEI